MNDTPKQRLSFVQWTGIVVAIAIAALFVMSDKPASRTDARASTSTAAPAATAASKTEQPSSPSWEEMDRITERLNRQDRKVLSMIPAQGYKDGLAGVVRDYRLHINVNSELYFQTIALPDKKLPIGYYFSLYITRATRSGRYGELEGVHAVWFRAKDQPTFAPWNPWAQHFSDHDNWLIVGGALDQEAEGRRRVENVPSQ